jgi:hypothetical protein
MFPYHDALLASLSARIAATVLWYTSDGWVHADPYHPVLRRVFQTWTLSLRADAHCRKCGKPIPPPGSVL